MSGGFVLSPRERKRGAIWYWRLDEKNPAVWVQRVKMIKPKMIKAKSRKAA